MPASTSCGGGSSASSCSQRGGRSASSVGPWSQRPVDQRGLELAAAALAQQRRGGRPAGDPVVQDEFLRQHHDARRRQDALAADRRYALTVPARVELAEPGDEALVEAEPAAQALRHLAVAGEDVAGELAGARQAAQHRLRGGQRERIGMRGAHTLHQRGRRLAAPAPCRAAPSRAAARARRRRWSPSRRSRHCSR